MTAIGLASERVSNMGAVELEDWVKLVLVNSALVGTAAPAVTLLTG